MANIFVRAIAKIFSRIKKRKPRIHDFTKLTWGEDYIFEPIQGGRKGYLTAQKSRVKEGDYIILLENNHSFRYQIEKIEHYANPSNMWIAIVKKDIIKKKKAIALFNKILRSP